MGEERLGDGRRLELSKVFNISQRLLTDVKLKEVIVGSQRYIPRNSTHIE